MSIAKVIEGIDAATADEVVSSISSEDRIKLLQSSDKLRFAYEDPMAATFRMMFAVSSSLDDIALSHIALGPSVGSFKDSCRDESHRCCCGA